MGAVWKVRVEERRGWVGEEGWEREWMELFGTGKGAEGLDWVG